MFVECWRALFIYLLIFSVFYHFETLVGLKNNDCAVEQSDIFYCLALYEQNQISPLQASVAHLILLTKFVVLPRGKRSSHMHST